MDSFGGFCLWRYVHLAQTGRLNNYARAVYMHGACIFMHGGGFGTGVAFATGKGMGVIFFTHWVLHAWHTNVIQNSTPSKSFFAGLPQPIRVKFTAVHAEVPMLWMRLA